MVRVTLRCSRSSTRNPVPPFSLRTRHDVVAETWYPVNEAGFFEDVERMCGGLPGGPMLTADRGYRWSRVTWPESAASNLLAQPSGDADIRPGVMSLPSAFGHGHLDACHLIRDSARYWSTILAYQRRLAVVSSAWRVKSKDMSPVVS